LHQAAGGRGEKQEEYETGERDADQERALSERPAEEADPLPHHYYGLFLEQQFNERPPGSGSADPVNHKIMIFAVHKTI